MFGDLEGLTRLALTEREIEAGVQEVFGEDRGYDWYITYYVYEDKCIVVEYMDGNHEHCKETCDDLNAAIAVASKWC